MTDAALATPDDDALAEGDGAVASPDLWRIPGEATPAWVIGLLGLLGATLAVVAVNPWVADDPTPTPVAASLSTPTPAPPAAVEPIAPLAPIAPSAAPSAATPSPAETPAAAPSAPLVAAPTPAAPTGEPAAAPTETAPTETVSAETAPTAGPTRPTTTAPTAPIPVAPPAPAVVAPVVVVAPPAPVVAPPAPCLPIVGIPFARASARLEPGPWEAASEPLRRWLVDHPEAVLSVEGHADTSGAEDYNVVLSFARARATIAALARLGVAEARMAPRAAGTSQPRNSPLGITTNRLVVLQVEGVEICRDTGAARHP